MRERWLRAIPSRRASAEYLERHIPEEMHGDEPGGAALDDLAALGSTSPPSVRARSPPRLAELIGKAVLLDQAQPPRRDPRGGLARGVPPGGGLRRATDAADGSSRPTASASSYCTELDIEHAAELEQVLDSLPLQPEHEQAIALSALQTMALLTAAWMDVLENQPVASTGEVPVHEACKDGARATRPVD